MRVGILTGGGDCSGLNAAVRGVAKSLMHQYGAEVIGIEEGFLGMIEKRTRTLSLEEVDGILDQGGTILGTSNRASPLDFKGKDVTQDVADYYEELGLDCIVSMGGDGSMTICYEMSKKGLNFVGVPKTIDNDLTGTDRTFGFDTAVNIAAESLDRLRTTGKSHKRVMILETMGRYAGWIALHAGVAGAADVILIPEFPYHIDEVINTIEKRAQKEEYTVIVIAEGSKPFGGDLVVDKAGVNAPDPIRLGGVGRFLQAQLEERIDAEVRTTILGHVQRGGTPSPYDRIFATNVGAYAASLVASKRYGRMVTVADNRLSSVALEEVAHNTRMVPTDDMTLVGAVSMGVSFGDPDLQVSLIDLKDGDIKMS